MLFVIRAREKKESAEKRKRLLAISVLFVCLVCVREGQDKSFASRETYL